MNKAIHLFPFLLLFLFIGNTSLLAQKKCGQDLYQQQLMLDNPNYQYELEELEEFYLEEQNKAQSRSSNFIIPVVVHVIHKGESVGQGTNVSDARIFSQIESLNEDFQRMNADASNTPSNYGTLATDTGIEFCLASIDDAGNPTNGITRNQYNSISSISYIANTVKPNTIWDPLKYLNIWVLQMPDQTILGYSFLPTQTMVGSNRDGLVLNYKNFGYISNTNSGRTATHELGHYLGLKHMWGDNDSNGNPEGCSSDDGISDTPNSAAPYFNCPSFGLSSCGSVDMHMNYMDYVNDNCMNLFTKGQTERMQSTLTGIRSALVGNANTACNVECLNLSTNDLEMGFEASESTAGWVIENTNGDNFGWSLTQLANTNVDYGGESSQGLALYLWNANAAADDYFFSPCFRIKGNEIYELTFSYACASDINQLYEEAFEVGFSFDQSSADFQVPSTDWQFNPVSNDFPNYQQATLRFYNQWDANVSVGFHVFSPADRYAMQIDNIKIVNTGLVDTEDKEVVEVDNILLYPNPTNGELSVNLQFTDTKEEVEVILQDLTGRILETRTLNNVSDEQFQFDLSYYNSGLYLVTVKDGQNAVTRKVTKF